MDLKHAHSYYNLFDKLRQYPEEYKLLGELLREVESEHGMYERFKATEDFYKREIDRLKKVEDQYEKLKSISSADVVRLAEEIVKREELESRLSWIENPDSMGR